MKRGSCIMPVACELITVFTAIVIFRFSAQNSGQSNGLSLKIAAWALELLPLAETPENLDLVNLVLRKLAHFSAYALLGFGLTGVAGRQKRVPVLPAVLLLGGLFALSDEFHQSFSPGRSPSLWDVGLDTCGAAAGWAVFRLAGRIRERKSSGS